MGWLIGRTRALHEPDKAREMALEKLQALTDLDDPEQRVVPILIDAILMVEAYRGARHQFDLLPELTASVDALIRELDIVEKSALWAAE